MVELGTRTTRCSRDAAPVGVVPEYRRLDERGIGDSARSLVSLRIVERTRNTNGYESCGAFAVGCHPPRNGIAHRQEGTFEAVVCCRIQLDGRATRSCRTTGEQIATVVRGRIGIDRNLVERLGNNRLERMMQNIGGHRHVGRNT